MTPILLALALACRPGPPPWDSGKSADTGEAGHTDDSDTAGDTDTAAETTPLVFAGVRSVEASGADALEIAWDEGEGVASLEVSLEDAAGTVTVHEADGVALRVEGLAEGLYRVRVEATGEDGTTSDGDVVLEQLVGDNRLLYRGELALAPAADVWGEGDVAVLAGWESGVSFLVADVSDPEAPQSLAVVEDGGYVKDLKIADGLLFSNAECGCRAASPEWDAHDKIGARIYDFSDPTAPTLLGTIGEPSPSVHNVSYGEGYLYLTDNMRGEVHAWDVSDPTAPAFAWAWQPPAGGSVHDQAWVDGKLYVAHWNGFAILDVSDPAAPQDLVVRVVPQPSAVHNIWPTEDGSHVLTTDEMKGGHLRVWDVRDPEQVEQVGSYVTDLEHAIHNVHVEGDLAFVSWYVDGAVVLDVSDPTTPELVGWYDTLDESHDHTGDTGDTGHEDTGEHPHEGEVPLYDGAWGIFPYGDHVLVGDMRRGLLVLDWFPRLVEAE